MTLRITPVVCAPLKLVENGLDPRNYLVYLFEQIPNLPNVTKTALAAYLPWNQTVKADCRANSREAQRSSYSIGGTLGF